jgi:hypothetical protein
MVYWWNDTDINIKVFAEKQVKLPLYQKFHNDLPCEEVHVTYHLSYTMAMTVQYFFPLNITG